MKQHLNKSSPDESESQAHAKKLKYSKTEVKNGKDREERFSYSIRSAQRCLGSRQAANYGNLAVGLTANVSDLMTKPLVVPATQTVIQLLETFKRNQETYRAGLG